MNRTSLIVAVAVAAFGLLATACEYSEVDGVGTRTADAEAPPQDDLTGFAGCSNVTGVRWDISGAVTNRSEVVSTYQVTVAFTDGDQRLAERQQWIRDLGVGDTAELRSVWLDPDVNDRVVACEVVTINRFG